MKTGLKWLVGVWLLVLFFGVKQVEAVPVVLSDTPADAGEYMDSMLIDPGSLYRFSFSYWIETDFSPDPTVATNHDTFFYALFSGTDSDINNISNEFLSNNPVDITAIILETNPVVVTYNVATSPIEQYLFPYFLVDNGNPDFYSTVHVDYSFEKVESVPVPEPSTIFMLGLSMFAYIGIARRRK